MWAVKRLWKESKETGRAICPEKQYNTITSEK
jgi:hypothetical protein